eukprot:Platyproteum_vivax@DN14980_c0_g1_i1.p1
MQRELNTKLNVSVKMIEEMEKKINFWKYMELSESVAEINLILENLKPAVDSATDDVQKELKFYIEDVRKSIRQIREDMVDFPFSESQKASLFAADKQANDSLHVLINKLS